MVASVALSTDSDATILRYSADAEIGGRIASVGSRLIQTVAKKNVDDFFSAFARQLTGETQNYPQTASHDTAAVSDRLAPTAMSTGNSFRGGQTAPAWLVVFGTVVGVALGYFIALTVR